MNEKVRASGCFMEDNATSLLFGTKMEYLKGAA